MLTPKQEKFVQNLLQGMSQREAFKHSYNAEKMKDTTIDTKASKLFNQYEIRKRYEELLAVLRDKAVMNAFEKRVLLRNIATDMGASNADRIKAIDTDNKMAGEYVTKIEGDIKIKKLEDLL